MPLFAALELIAVVGAFVTFAVTLFAVSIYAGRAPAPKPQASPRTITPARRSELALTH
jgi:hypothetical protein